MLEIYELDLKLKGLNMTQIDLVMFRLGICNSSNEAQVNNIHMLMTDNDQFQDSQIFQLQ